MKMKLANQNQFGFFRAGGLQMLAMLVLIMAMFTANKRAAAPALMAIVKFIWPLLVVWLIWRFIKSRVTAGVQKFQQQIMQAAQQNGVASGVASGRSGSAQGVGQIIDLCPKCGTLLSSGHQCVKK